MIFGERLCLSLRLTRVGYGQEPMHTTTSVFVSVIFGNDD